MSPTRKARSWAGRVGGRLDVVAGQRPLRATDLAAEGQPSKGGNDGGEGQEGQNREADDLGQAEVEEKDLSREVIGYWV